ncbi:MAG: TlpA family protein disulfide reductase [Mucilaginibacter sp.]
MKKRLFLFCLALFVTSALVAQVKTVVRKIQLDDNSVVMDSAGFRYPTVIWRKMMSSGDYTIKAINPQSDTVTFLLVKLSEAEKTSRYNRMPKPPESKFFANGEKIRSFNADDINGTKIKLKDLAGKVVVLNFWFIGCPPCRAEMPELNKIVAKYANDPDVIFVAVGLDRAYDIREFIKTSPFNYHIIDDGRIYASLYKINLYPTNVVVGKDGKVMFHSSGYAPNTPYWISKTIAEAKAAVL